MQNWLKKYVYFRFVSFVGIELMKVFDSPDAGEYSGFVGSMPCHADALATKLPMH